MKIMTVEDTTTVRKVIADIIRTLGHEVLEAPSGEEALALADEHPDLTLVLLDREMPGISGIEFLVAFRDDERFKDVPVVMVSGWADPDWIIEALNAGAEDFLPKPFTPELLSTKIARYVTVE